MDKAAQVPEPAAAVVALDPLERRLLNAYQRGFPLSERPYAEVGRHLGLSERAVLERLADLEARGVVSRIGAVVRPHAAGWSTLAALAVPPERLEAVAALVSGYREVNHNYEREHAYNLWFVVTAADAAGVRAVLADIARLSGLEPLDLPLAEPFHLDLGFALP